MCRSSFKVENVLRRHGAEKTPREKRRKKNGSGGGDQDSVLKASDDTDAGEFPQGRAPEAKKRDGWALRREFAQEIFEEFDHVHAEFLAEFAGIKDEELRVDESAEVNEVLHVRYSAVLVASFLRWARRTAVSIRASSASSKSLPWPLRR